MMNTPDHIFYPPLFPLQEPFKGINIERRDIVCLEPDEEVDLRCVQAFETVRFVQVRMERLFEVLGVEILLHREVSHLTYQEGRLTSSG